MKFTAQIALLPLLTHGFVVPLMAAKGTAANPVQRGAASNQGSSEVNSQGETSPPNSELTTRGNREELSQRDNNRGRIALRHPWRRASDMLSNWERLLFGPDIMPFSVGDLLSDEEGGDVPSAITSYFGSPSMGHLDISETDKEWKVTVDLPGIKKEDIQLELDQGMLSISAERREDREIKEGETITRQERSFGSVRRVLRLPSNVNPDQQHVKAKFEHGVLSVCLEKQDDHKPQTKQIAIE